MCICLTLLVISSRKVRFFCLGSSNPVAKACLVYILSEREHLQVTVMMFLLTVLHDQRLAHTDLKPENILFVDSDYEYCGTKRIHHKVSLLASSILFIRRTLVHTSYLVIYNYHHKCSTEPAIDLFQMYNC